MNPQERQGRAAETLARYRASGQTQRDFCQAEDLSYSTLKYWLKRERIAKLIGRSESKASSEPTADRFVAVVASESEQDRVAPGLTIVLENGMRLEVAAGYPASELCRIATQLSKEARC